MRTLGVSQPLAVAVLAAVLALIPPPLVTTRRTILPALKSCMALAIAAVAALPHDAHAAENAFCEGYVQKTHLQAEANRALNCFPDIHDDFTYNFNSCMDLGQDLINTAMKLRDDRLAECQLGIANRKGEAVEKPGDIIEKQRGPAAPPMATVTEDVDVYDKPGRNVTGVLRSTNTVELAGACKKKGRCNVLGPAVPGGKGWVWGRPSSSKATAPAEAGA